MATTMNLLAETVKVASILNDLKIPYALVGGLACILLGVRRFTEDIDIIFEINSIDVLKKLYERLRSEGYEVGWSGFYSARPLYYYSE